MIKNSVLGILAVTSMLTCGCGGSPDEIGEYDTSEKVEQAISYGNNNCWWTGIYNEIWEDPNNPGEEHVVGWYQCSDYFASPISTYATVEAENQVMDWMIWQSGSSTYMIFVDGYYYYWRRYVLLQSATTIFGNIDLH